MKYLILGFFGFVLLFFIEYLRSPRCPACNSRATTKEVDSFGNLEDNRLHCWKCHNVWTVKNDDDTSN